MKMPLTIKILLALAAIYGGLCYLDVYMRPHATKIAFEEIISRDLEAEGKGVDPNALMDQLCTYKYAYNILGWQIYPYRTCYFGSIYRDETTGEKKFKTISLFFFAPGRQITPMSILLPARRAGDTYFNFGSPRKKSALVTWDSNFENRENLYDRHYRSYSFK